MLRLGPKALPSSSMNPSRPSMEATTLPVAAATAGLVYLVFAVILGGAFLYMAWQLLRTKGEGPWASITFHYSLAYLALLFVALAVDAVA